MKNLLVSLMLTSVFQVCAQEPKTTDFTAEIGKYDISDILTTDKIEIDATRDTMDRFQPLGYIGETYQRFQIHFISVIQNPNNQLEYLVYGKTKVKENVCSFQGTIRVIAAKTYDEGEIHMLDGGKNPALKQGTVSGSYEFFEDRDQRGTGILKGKFSADFLLDAKGKMQYDALTFFADGYSNNQFEGTWTAYGSKTSKKCNWGDYRIPDSKALDQGAGEFSPADEFLKNGWENYHTAYYTNESPQSEEARKKERKKWWISRD